MDPPMKPDAVSIPNDKPLHGAMQRQPPMEPRTPFSADDYEKRISNLAIYGNQRNDACGRAERQVEELKKKLRHRQRELSNLNKAHRILWKVLGLMMARKK